MDHDHHFFESQLAATLEQFQQLFRVWLAATNDLIECEREMANEYACNVRKARVDGAYAHMKQAKAAWYAIQSTLSRNDNMSSLSHTTPSARPSEYHHHHVDEDDYA